MLGSTVTEAIEGVFDLVLLAGDGGLTLCDRG